MEDRDPFRFIAVLLGLFAFFLIYSIAIAQIMLGMALLAWCIKLLRERPVRIDWSPLIYPILLFIFISFISALASNDILLSLYSFKEMLLFGVLILALNNLERCGQIDRIFIAMFCSMALGSAYGLFHYFFLSSGGLVSRLDIFHHYLTTAELIMMVLLVLTARFLFYSDRPTYFLVPAYLLIMTALAFTYARSAWIGFIAGMIFLCCLRKPVLLAFLPLLFVLIYFVSPGEVGQRIRSILDRKDPTVSERIYFHQSGVAMIKDHPLLGVGPDLANEHYADYRVADAPDRFIPHLHSNIIQIGAERGLLGLAAWLYFFGQFFRDGRVAWRRKKGAKEKYLISGALAAVIGMLTAGFFEYNFGDSEIQMWTFFMMSTLYVILKENEREK